MKSTQEKFTELLATRVAYGRRELVEDTSYANVGTWRAEDPKSFASAGRLVKFDFQPTTVSLKGVDNGRETRGQYVELTKAGAPEKLQDALEWATKFLLGKA